MTEQHGESRSIKNAPTHHLVKTGVVGRDGDSPVHPHHLVTGEGVPTQVHGPFCARDSVSKLQAAEVDAHPPLVTMFLSSPEFSPAGLLDLVHSAQEVEGGIFFLTVDGGRM